MKGALSGRELPIDEELTGQAIHLGHMPGFDPTRFCFLVDEEEWNELDKRMRLLQRYVSDEPIAPMKKMFIRHIEVRKR